VNHHELQIDCGLRLWVVEFNFKHAMVLLVAVDAALYPMWVYESEYISLGSLS